jgi:hypothetical protein
MSQGAVYLSAARKEGSAIWHLLTLPFILIGFLISGGMAVAGIALLSVFLIPFLLLALVFRVGFFFLKVVLVVVLGAVLLVSCV